MILNLALTLLAALLLSYAFTKMNLPGILGMVLAGVLLGPSLLDAISPELQNVLRDFKTIALIVILIRAGLGINNQTLHKVGKPAILMSFIPGILEGTTVLLAAHFLLGFTLIEGGMLGFIIAAVSPAVVVPQMLELKDGGFGNKREVPTLVLAGASVDDVFAITIFGVFVGLASGHAIDIGQILWKVPAGIALGAAFGMAIGFALIWFFRKYHIRDTKKVIIFMIAAVVFNELTELESIKQFIPLAGLLGIMAIGYIILEKYSLLANRLASKFSKVWVLAELLLFVYIGTEVQIKQIDASLLGIGLLILALGLTARSIGVVFSLLGSQLTPRERLFCVIAYFPKATVQAAIGAVPLTMIVAGSMRGTSQATGQIILTMAVLSIVITAPLGAIGIKLSGKHLLEKEEGV